MGWSELSCRQWEGPESSCPGAVVHLPIFQVNVNSAVIIKPQIHLKVLVIYHSFLLPRVFYFY